MTTGAPTAAPAPAPAALPFWLSLTFVPLFAAGLVYGGGFIVAIPLYGWGVMTLLDGIFGHETRNRDPETPATDLFWFRMVTLVWFPIQFVVLFVGLWVLTHGTHLGGWEKLGLMFGIGVTSGTIGIVYAHELMHKTGRTEQHLADALLAMVLYSHFRSEHLLVHHPWVGTGRDTVTARYNEGFHRFFARVLRQGPGSAWRAERALLARRGLPVWSRRNPFWKYAGLQLGFLGLAFAIGGAAGVGFFVLQAFVAIWQLELTNYVEHYGLTRRYLGAGRYEPCRPHHSWNADHKVSNLLLINLQRHSDHHCHPMRPYALLQTYGTDQAPNLPFGYPAMAAMAMIPPLWRRRMNRRVRDWRRQFYPDISDWQAYRQLSHPLPVGAG
ncbi:MAG: alkane 1-monooxygenase [Pseudorhodobacter sp.]|nr:alkane 1-monooxygenase [Pseudorhodobacter sp.]